GAAPGPVPVGADDDAGRRIAPPPVRRPSGDRTTAGRSRGDASWRSRAWSHLLLRQRAYAPLMHLLVIEDDQRLVRLLRRLLEEDRHVVETATTGQDGLDIVDATTGIEVVVLDLGLKDISGLEVSRRIRAAGSEVSILMLTARDTVGDRVTGLDAGADDYLVKPFAY